MHSGLMEQGFRVDVDGLRVLHRVGVEATDRAAWVGLLEELQALVEIVLEERERERRRMKIMLSFRLDITAHLAVA